MKFIHALSSARKSSNITQCELAIRLNKPQSFISKYESGERRLDVIEFLQICNALNIDPSIILSKIIGDVNEKVYP